MPFHFDNTYARLPDHFYSRVDPAPVAAPSWLAVNAPLGERLGLEAHELRSPELLSVFAGNRVPDGAEPIALAYAGHQFGGFVPRLGDGRAILLGEVVGTDGLRRDVQLKGSGRTPFSRGGDGRAALGPVLREFLVSEAMFALGVPTTRSLAAVLTGQPVQRETLLPGAVLTRVASSHLRVGTFEYFAHRGDAEAVATLVDYTLRRHFPERADGGVPALALFDAVMNAQSTLVAKWLALGFVHGVMNTDNCSIAGETIDYGPCAFLDAYEPTRTFSSIDAHGRYAFANQPRIAQWNLARLAETLLPLLGEDEPRGIAALEARLERFPTLFESAYGGELRKKLGLFEAHDGDLELAHDLLALMASEHSDYTRTFRQLVALSAGDEAPSDELFASDQRFAAWLTRWRARLVREGATPEARRERLRAANPAFIPRNHRVEEAIAAATAGDLTPFERLRNVLERPFDDQPEHAELAEPPGEDQWTYRTFCGT